MYIQSSRWTAGIEAKSWCPFETCSCRVFRLERITYSLVFKTEIKVRKVNIPVSVKGGQDNIFLY